MPSTVVRRDNNRDARSVVTRRVLALLCVLALTLLIRPLHAQDPMAAEVLFNEGVALMQAGDFGHACAKIAESQRLEPRAGTLFTLAECRAGEGLTATSLARYHEYLRWFHRMSDAEQRAQRGREGVAARKIDELDKVVPRLKIELANPVPPGTLVKRNDNVVGAASLAVWLPLDPGEHLIEAQAPGGSATIRRITLAAGQRQAVSLAVKAPLPAATSGPLSAPSGVAPRGTPAAPRFDVAETGLSKLTIGALLLGALSVVGVVAGTATGIIVLDQKANLDAECGVLGDPASCTAAGKRTADKLNALAAVSTASFVIGGASGGAAITLLLLDAPSAAASPSSSAAPSAATGPAVAAWVAYTAYW